MNGPVLSIIIPLYNCAPYINRCLSSLFLQNVKMEIIVVDDGSTDGGDRIVEQTAISSSSKIQLLRQSNKGPSAARNRGLKAASGKYIYFMDADDFIKPNTLSSVIALMETHSAEIARFQTQIILEDKAEIFASATCECLPLEVNCVFDGIEYIEHTHAMAGVTLWCHVILRNLVERANISFNEKLFLEEDYVYLLNLLIHAKKVIVCDGDKSYFWVKRTSSSSNSVNLRALYSYNDLFAAYTSLLKIYTDNISPVCRDYIYVRLALAIQIYLFSLIRQKKNTELKEAIAILKRLDLYPFKTYRALNARFNPMRGNKIKWFIANVEPILGILKLKNSQ